MDLSVGLAGTAEVLLGGERLNIDQEAALGVSGAVLVLGVLICAGVFNKGSEGLVTLGNLDLLVLVLLFPSALGGVLGIEEGNDGSGLDLLKAQLLTVGELSSPLAAVILGALLLVGCFFVIAASGVRLVPGHLGSLGECSNNEGSGNEELSNHFSRDILLNNYKSGIKNSLISSILFYL